MASYLYGSGNQWRRALGLPDVQQEEETQQDHNTNNEGRNIDVEGIVENDGEGNENEEERENNHLTSISLQKYLLNQCDSEGRDSFDADTLDWLRVYIFSNNNYGNGNEDNDEGITTDNHESARGKVIESEIEAKEIISNLSARQRKSISSFLCEHVPQTFRVSTISKKDMILWLMKENATRNYLFYKPAGLKHLMTERGIPTTGRGSREKKIEALVSFDMIASSSSPNDAEENQINSEEIQAPTTCPLAVVEGNSLSELQEKAVKKILERSFLPHQKGEQRDHCSLGHRLEKPILKNWMKLFEAGEYYSGVEGLEVKSAYTAGLAAKKSKEFAKDSIDFVLLVGEKGEEEEDAESTDADLEVWGFEAKSRVTNATALLEEEDFSALLFEKHLRISSHQAFEVIRLEGEKFQIMQHAYVYNLDTVVLAISDAHSEIIRSIIIDFDREIKEKFGKVLGDMMNFSLSWLYSCPKQGLLSNTSTNSRIRRQSVKIPDNIIKIAKDLPNINGKETIQGAVNLYHSIHNLPRPLPSFHRLIPAIYAFWNAVKGGSDTTTKLMDLCTLYLPHTNCETVASARLIMLLFVVIHRLIQAFSGQEDLNTYPSLFVFRRNASKRFSFHKTLLTCFDVFCNEMKRMEKEADKENCSNTQEQAQAPQHRQPNLHRFGGVIPEQVKFAPALQTTTPKKVTLKVQSGDAPTPLKDMVFHCTGMPMKSHEMNNNIRFQQRCDYCSRKTSWFCAGCKRWLCMERRSTKDNSRDMKLYSHKVKDKLHFFHKQCFHIFHEDAWTRKTRSDPNSSFDSTSSNVEM